QCGQTTRVTSHSIKNDEQQFLKNDDIFLPYKHPLYIYEYEFDMSSLVFKHDSFVFGSKRVKVVAEKGKAAPSWPTSKSVRNEVIRLHKPIDSKMDSKFLNHCWRTMWGKLSSKLLLLTAFHP
ncbi:hypothetical protein CR513_44436, partial [Mucuna pruriens]